MASSSAAPLQDRYPYMYKYKLRTEITNERKIIQGRSSLPAIVGPIDYIWKISEIAISGVMALAKDLTYIGSSRFSLPARIELRWNKDDYNPDGLVVFDSRGRLIVHIPDAILYSGDLRLELTTRIVELLGVPARLFKEIQKEFQNKNYMIVISRQKYTEHDGRLEAMSTLEVEDSWTYWTTSAKSKG